MLGVLFSTVSYAFAAAALANPAAPEAGAPAATAGAAESAVGPVFARRSDAEVADAVVRYLNGIGTIKGEFTQTAPSGEVATGEFYLRRPGQIRFDYDDPSPLTIVATQGMVYVEDQELEQTDSYPLGETPLKFLLSRDVDLSDARLVSVERAADSVALTYASADEETQGELTLAFAAPELALREWAVRDPQGGVTAVALRNLEVGVRLDNRLFRAPEAGGAFIKD